MNFNQWQGYARKQDVSKVTYVCGDQFTLVELVIDDIKNILQAPATDFINLDAGQDEITWESISQYPLDPEANRLTIIRNAEQISDWSGIYDWLANSRSNPKNYLLLISYQSDASAIFSKGKKVTYAEHIELIRTKGKFIRCSMPNDEDLMKWVTSYGLTSNAAKELIERTSGDTAELYNVLRKVHLWQGSPNAKALALLSEELALDSFADYLITQDKVAAYTALKTISEDEVSRVVARLDSRLTMISEIGRCVRRRMYDGDIAATTGIKIFLIKKFKPVVRDYDDKKIKYCRQLLATIDGAMRDGAKVGVLEALICLW